MNKNSCPDSVCVYCKDIISVTVLIVTTDVLIALFWLSYL